MLRDGTIPAYGFVPPGTYNYETYDYEWKDWPMEKRLEEARRLYKEAGYSEDNPLKIEYRRIGTFLSCAHALWQDFFRHDPQSTGVSRIHDPGFRRPFYQNDLLLLSAQCFWRLTHIEFELNNCNPCRTNSWEISYYSTTKILNIIPRPLVRCLRIISYV